jgi:hypothetical protein
MFLVSCRKNNNTGQFMSAITSIPMTDYIELQRKAAKVEVLEQQLEQLQKQVGDKLLQTPSINTNLNIKLEERSHNYQHLAEDILSTLNKEHAELAADVAEFDGGTNYDATSLYDCYKRRRDNMETKINNFGDRLGKI